MLLYGGLIASRTSHDTTRTVLARLDVLREEIEEEFQRRRAVFRGHDEELLARLRAIG